MKIIQKNISEIKPDPKQPRQHITEKMVNEMAVSIKNEGVINPIEIDKDSIIITGELRWRASEKAGLKTIPCKILEIADNDRFIRQMQENIHHNTMNAWDTAKGYEKTIKILFPAAGKSQKIGRPLKKYLKNLSKLYGKGRNSISGSLDHLKEPKRIQKFLKRKDFAHTKITEANKAPKEYVKILKDKVTEQEYIPRDAVRTIRAGLLRADMFSDKGAAKKILSFDYKDEEGRPMTNREVVLEVNKIIPDTQQILGKDIDRVKQITQIATDLGNLLKENKLSSINEPLSKMSLTFQLNILILILGKYLKSQTFTKQLTDVNRDRTKLLKG